MLYENYLSPFPVTIKKSDLFGMVRTAKLLTHLVESEPYRLYVTEMDKDVTRFDPGYGSVFLCYDFHLSDNGPKLIEINTNAGGGLLALLAHLPAEDIASLNVPEQLQQQICDAFLATYRAYGGNGNRRPANIFIFDQQPEEEFLFPEMQAFAKILSGNGIPTQIVGTAQFRFQSDGVYVGDEKVDMLYMRHCDFYLDDPALEGLKDCYLQRQVCLSPNPFDYALLSDKRRLRQFSDASFLTEMGLSEKQRGQLLRYIPEAHVLKDVDPDEIWSSRKKWVMKPVEGFGSQDIYFGRKISRTRFASLDKENTLVQELVPPSTVVIKDQDEMKADFRLFAFKDQIFGLAARLYRGRLTNMQTDGGGFAVVKLAEKESS